MSNIAQITADILVGANLLKLKKKKQAEKDRILMVKGERGEKGERGAQGLDGRDGKDGMDGKDGVTTVVTKEILYDTSKYDKKFETLEEELRRINNNVKGGVHGFGLASQITKIIQVSETSAIPSSALDVTKINIILVMQPNITITLPNPTAEKIVIVQQGYTGSDTYTVNREAI